MKKIDFSAETGKVKTLALGPDARNIFSGETSGEFKPAAPFVFLGLAN